MGNQRVVLVVVIETKFDLWVTPPHPTPRKVLCVGSVWNGPLSLRLRSLDRVSSCLSLSLSFLFIFSSSSKGLPVSIRLRFLLPPIKKNSSSPLLSVFFFLSSRLKH